MARKSASEILLGNESSVVIPLWKALPPLGLLAGDVRLGALPLGVQRVELLLEAILRTLAGVDGAPHARRRLWLRSLAHALAPDPFLPRADGRPKKLTPFQCAPVTFPAMAVSER